MLQHCSTHNLFEMRKGKTHGNSCVIQHLTFKV
ncbi:hypothetical protein M8C21_000616, partial [Ambrosia artemisiifolia]